MAWPGDDIWQAGPRKLLRASAKQPALSPARTAQLVPQPAGKFAVLIGADNAVHRHRLAHTQA